MSVKNLFKIIISYLSFFLLASCNAPRDNPLDPYSSSGNLAQIEGTVQTLSAPFNGIPDISVFWQPASILVKTDNSGNFLINNVKPVDGLLIFQKEGYSTDTLKISWNNTKKVVAPIVHLNKIPKLDKISIYSEVVNQSAQNQITNLADLMFKVKVNDVDDDIDSVFITNDTLDDFSGGLVLTGKTYQGSFSTADLNVTDIEQTIGSTFNVYVIDKFGKSYMIGSGKVARIIKNGSEIISPADNDTLSVPLQLNWKQFTAGYPFHYKVEIYNAANLQSVYSDDGIDPNQLSLQVDTASISSGDYLWSVFVVDEFSDSYKSQPGKFHIQ